LQLLADVAFAAVDVLVRAEFGGEVLFGGRRGDGDGAVAGFRDVL